MNSLILMFSIDFVLAIGALIYGGLIRKSLPKPIYYFGQSALLITIILSSLEIWSLTHHG
jgi:hypothetical protein